MRIQFISDSLNWWTGGHMEALMPFQQSGSVRVMWKTKDEVYDSAREWVKQASRDRWD
jgi:hypothetical protein